MVKNQSIKKNALAPTILVSGGAGFIGSHLVEALLGNGAKVLVVDNFNTGNEIHVKHLLSNPNFALFNVDINEGLPKEIESVDYVFHLAGIEDYMYSGDVPSLDSLLTNSLGTKNLLDLVKRSEAKFVLVSTIDIYQGRMSQADLVKYFGLSKSEENKFSLIEAKRFAEAIVWEYFKKYNLDVRIARIPEVYGPRMSLDSSGMLGVYLKSMLDGRELVVDNDGIEKEYYLYVSDAVSGVLRALFNPGTKGKIYSLVPESAISHLELAYLLKSVADGNLHINFKQSSLSYPARAAEPDTFNLKDLGWKPRISIKAGVIDTLKNLGYAVNQNSFKPLKYIDEKAKSQTPSQPVREATKPDTVTSIYPSPETDLYARHFSQVEQSNKKKLIFPLFRKKDAEVHVETVKTERVSKTVKSRKGTFVFIALALLVAAFLVFVVNPIFSVYNNSMSGIKTLKKVADDGAKFDTASLSRDTDFAALEFESARKNLSNTKWLFSFAGRSSEYISYFRMLTSLNNFSNSIGHLAKSAEPLGDMWEILRPDTDKVLTQEMINNAKLEIGLAQNNLYLAEADFRGVDQSHIPEKYRSYLSGYGGYIDFLQSNLELTSKIIGDAADVMGVSRETTYIVWFQNSNEIRPTGGFIGSYGLLTFDKGKLKDLKIDDIYNPDGQIKLRDIKTPLPAVMADYLKEDRLYLRNSNWEINFSDSARAFDDLYYKVTGQKVDGYLAVDLKFVEGLLRATGPVFLAAYNEEINAENLYERAQYHSDYNYVDGSDQKRSFLTILGSKLLEKMFSLPKDKLPGLLSEVGGSLDQKHLLVYLSDSTLNDLLKEKGWDGEIADTAGDYLYVVNSNLGGTKANYFVKNSLDYEVNSLTRDGLLRAVLKLTYVHTGDSMAWPGGPYKDYVRTVVQKGSKLTGAELIGADGKVTDIFKNIVVETVDGKDMFSYGIVVNPKETVSLILKYDLPENLSITKEQLKYSLYTQKQPGADADQFIFTFNAPFGTGIQKASSGLDIVDSQVIANSQLQKDLNYFIELR